VTALNLVPLLLQTTSPSSRIRSFLPLESKPVAVLPFPPSASIKRLPCFFFSQFRLNRPGVDPFFLPRRGVMVPPPLPRVRVAVAYLFPLLSPTNPFMSPDPLKFPPAGTLFSSPSLLAVVSFCPLTKQRGRVILSFGLFVFFLLYLFCRSYSTPPIGILVRIDGTVSSRTDIIFRV